MVQVESMGRESSLYTPEQVIRRMEGGLNWTTVVVPGVGSSTNTLLAIRQPKPAYQREGTEQAIREEYDAVGALAAGVDFKLRSLEEQKRFMDMSTSLGLKALGCQMLADGEMVTEFIQGVSLSEYVGRDQSRIKSDVVEGVLSHLTYAHSLGVVFGDRWTTNTLITPDDSYIELDFDLELTGNHKTNTTFEMAQTLYHLIHFAEPNREYVADTIDQVYKDQPHLLAGYDQAQMTFFLNGQRRYFYEQYEKEGSLYEGIVPPNDAVIELTGRLNAAWEHVPEGPITNSLPRPKFNDNQIRNKGNK